MIHRRQEGHEIRQVQKDNREIGAGGGGGGAGGGGGGGWGWI